MAAGNFLLTVRGSWGLVRRSYALLFVLVGVWGYALASTQGTIEAFRTAQVYWHFTNYTVIRIGRDPRGMTRRACSWWIDYYVMVRPKHNDFTPSRVMLVKDADLRHEARSANCSCPASRRRHRPKVGGTRV